MDVDSSLDEALRRAGEAVRPDVSDALQEVRARDRRRTVRRRAVVGVAVAGVVLVGGVVARLGAPGSDRPDPAGPPRETTPSSAASLTLVRQASATSLGLRKLLSVAVSPDGRVYVTDTSQRVAELTPDLEVRRTWGASGAAPGEFRLVQGAIAVGGDGSVYVSDTGNFRVQVFDGRGRFLRSIGAFGSGPGQFTWPFDLTVDADGNVYVADDKEQTLAKLSPTGRQLWRRGGLDETDPLLVGHLHLAMLDPRGRLIVTNDDAGKVVLIDQDGTVAEVVPVTATGSDGVCDASVAADRYFLTSCFVPSAVDIYAADGTPVATWTGPGLVQSPRWTADGHGYAVTADGGIAEVVVKGD
jgi:sugar lactone lactonase YvrE